MFPRWYEDNSWWCWGEYAAYITINQLGQLKEGKGGWVDESQTKIDDFYSYLTNLVNDCLTAKLQKTYLVTVGHRPSHGYPWMETCLETISADWQKKHLSRKSSCNEMSLFPFLCDRLLYCITTIGTNLQKKTYLAKVRRGVVDPHTLITSYCKLARRVKIILSLFQHFWWSRVRPW